MLVEKSTLTKHVYTTLAGKLCKIEIPQAEDYNEIVVSIRDIGGYFTFKMIKSQNGKWQLPIEVLPSKLVDFEEDLNKIILRQIHFI